MKLSRLPIGSTATILSVGGSGALRQHFLDMGLIQGTEVTVVKYAPMGDPIELRIHGYELTIRLEDAENIEISEPHQPVDVQKKSQKTEKHHPGYGEGGKFHNRKEENPLPEGETLTFALVGNQNCGKTTLFNQLTGSRQHVGNFPGVTVDRKDGVIRGYDNTLITDLPGIYSMSPYSSEEIVTREFVIQTRPKGIINIVDATNIERNLYLTMQLLELGIPMVVALNMMDELWENGGSVLVNEMEEALGVPVIPISAAKGEGIEGLTAMADTAMTAAGVNSVVQSLVIDGIFGGVGGVLSFLPIIVTLFFFLSLLEDSGYMARVAFIMDKLLRKLGLSGRSIVPMLVGFGCTVPGVMASRTLPSERDRKMTILLTPFMSCTAKLPIYAFFTEAFFPEHQALVMIGLYVLGIFMGILMALIFKKTSFKGEAVPFVMELPNYRMPGAANVGHLLWEKAKDFLQRAFTVIFLATIAIWFLQNFDTGFNMVADSQDSILALLAGALAPVFLPVGFGDWRIVTALISGFMAKESVVSSLTVLFGSMEALQGTLTVSGAVSLLVFCLLYTPCVAAIASVKRELGGKWAAAMAAGQCVLAWIAAFIVYQAALLL